MGERQRNDDQKIFFLIVDDCEKPDYLFKRARLVDIICLKWLESDLVLQ